MALDVVRAVFLGNPDLCRVVAKSTYERLDVNDEIQRRTKCLSTLCGGWEGPSSKVWADEERVYTQKGAVSVTWKALEKANRMVSRRLKAELPCVLTVSEPFEYRYAQAALLVEVSLDFAVMYAFSCCAHAQHSAAPQDLARGVHSAVTEYVYAPERLLRLCAARPTAEWRALAALRGDVVRLPIHKRKCLMALLDTPHFDFNTNGHHLAWRVWLRLSSALKIAVEVISDGILLGETKNDKIRYIRVKSSRNDRRAPIHIYEASEFEMMILQMCWHPVWAEKEKEGWDLKTFLPKPIFLGIRLLQSTM